MLNVKELRGVSVACGLASTASRSVQLEALRSFYLRDARSFPLQGGGPILSLDLGLKNLAACVLEGAESRVLSWRKYDLAMPETYCPRAFAEHLKGFCEQTLLPSFPGRIVFIERQRHRSGSMAGIFETIVRLAILEAQLHAILQQKAFVCVPVNPAAVARFHDLPTGKEKKAAAVSKVRALHSQGSVQIPDTLFSYFSRESKKDDLADSLLQAFAGVAFRRNCRQFFEQQHPELLPEKELLSENKVIITLR